MPPSSSPEPSGTLVYSPKVGMLSSAVRELSDILEHMGPSPGCKKCSGGSEGAAKVEFQLHSTNESYDKLVILARQSEARLRSKEEEVLELQSKVKLNGSQIIMAIHPNPIKSNRPSFRSPRSD